MADVKISTVTDVSFDLHGAAVIHVVNNGVKSTVTVPATRPDADFGDDTLVEFVVTLLRLAGIRQFRMDVERRTLDVPITEHEFDYGVPGADHHREHYGVAIATPDEVIYS